VAAFIGFFLHALWRSRRVPPGPLLWIHTAILIALVEAPYYELTTLLPLVFAAMAILYRELDGVPRPAPARVQPEAIGAVT
jgi:hypothetical protein